MRSQLSSDLADPAPAAAAVVAGVEVPQRLAESLPLPASAAEVAQFVALRAAACVGADYSNLALLDADASSLRLFHGAFLDPDIADRYMDVAVDAPFPIAAAVRSESAVLLPDLDSYRSHFPDILADTIAAGVRATASIPLHRSDGSVIGAIGFAWSDPPRFDLKLEQALRAVAHLCTETVERAERYDVEHQLLIDLHHRLLDELPTVPGIEMAARYRPAGDHSLVGGDWYEVLLLDDDRMAVVVGDVTGHGLVAAADMALVRGMIGALLHAGIAVRAVFPQMSELFRKRRNVLIATAAIAVIDSSGLLTYATAGHPPPLVVHADGTVQALDSANAPIIGILETRHVEGTVPFPAGAQLVMYTDGLVERPNRPFSEGVEIAAGLLRSLPADTAPEALIDSLLTALIGDAQPSDDLAVVVVKRPT